MEAMPQSQPEDRIDALGGKVDQLDTKVDRLGNRVDKLDTKVDQLGEKMTREFTAVRGEMNDEFTAVRGETKAGFDRVDDRFDGLNRRLLYVAIGLGGAGIAATASIMGAIIVLL